MDVEIKPGRYVLAVSGGVDSVVLLHVLQSLPGVQLTVAHFDHGIREDSAEDKRHVQALASQYRLPFVFDRANLGAGASEAMARQARYEFLQKVQQIVQAKAIITAHHQDDKLETAILNMTRGTGRKGLSALANNVAVIRPLLDVTKAQITTYAQSNGLVWREDSTNLDPSYARNYLRQKLPHYPEKTKRQLITHIDKLEQINQDLDLQLSHYLHVQSRSHQLDRRAFITLPHAVALEVLAHYLREHGLREFDRKTLERLVVQAKVGAPGQRFDVRKGTQMTVTRDYLALKRTER